VRLTRKLFLLAEPDDMARAALRILVSQRFRHSNCTSPDIAVARPRPF